MAMKVFGKIFPHDSSLAVINWMDEYIHVVHKELEEPMLYHVEACVNGQCFVARKESFLEAVADVIKQSKETIGRRVGPRRD